MSDLTRDSALLPPTQALRRGFSLGAATAPAASGAAAIRRQGFRVGPLRLMIALEDGNELTELPALHRLPRAPAWFLGMANLHGALVPVFDPAEIFGVRRGEDKAMLLVLGHGEEKAGLVIDGLPRRLQPLAQQRIGQPMVPPALAGCVGDAYWIDDEDWTEFRYAALYDRLEAELAQ